ncbi:metal-sensitive transcriptional repressor family protein [Nocardiopsis exhalans]|uniref:Metal-sensitive transcriptional repressor family protein n=1 Tax=Nocardiopsis exhalans TaxID=163604 RepID=A0ABY5D5M4_9ACTN|nr:metal-sensitive transcriptional repressor family protein [Nocardiopsis exhalans]USY18388.1 metal-sensitive transcriptional repressor family protein [Nocardiopsis exhalans]
MSPDLPPVAEAPEDGAAENSRARTLERRLALPVLICAVVSVPAVFLGMWGDGWWAEFGHRVNWLAGLVLWVEWILLIALAENKLGWLRTHKWSTFVAAVTLPAVFFALGPTQVLRLLRVAGTLRLLRVTRIIEAGGVLRRRMGMTGRGGTVVAVATTVLSAVFVTAVLADPTSTSRRYAESLLESVGGWPVALAAALLSVAIAVVIVHRWRRARALLRGSGPGPKTSPEPGSEFDPQAPPQSSP